MHSLTCNNRYLQCHPQHPQFLGITQKDHLQLVRIGMLWFGDSSTSWQLVDLPTPDAQLQISLEVSTPGQVALSEDCHLDSIGLDGMATQCLTSLHYCSLGFQSHNKLPPRPSWALLLVAFIPLSWSPVMVFRTQIQVNIILGKRNKCLVIKSC